MFRSFFTAPHQSIPSIQTHLAHCGIYVSDDEFDDIQHSIDSMLDTIPIQCRSIISDNWFHVNPSHLKYHQEPYGWHALCAGIVSAFYARRFGGDFVTGFRLGFLHDIGKSLVESPKHKTNGHGQVGAHVAEIMLRDIDPDLRNVMLFLIDQHTCVCTHEPLDKPHLSCKVLAMMTLSWSVKMKNDYLIYYKALTYGDNLGKISETKISVPEVDSIVDASWGYIEMNYIQLDPLSAFFRSTGSFSTVVMSTGFDELLQTKRTIFIVMHGSQGCGKSYAAKMVTDILESAGLCVGIAERDYMFWLLARKNHMIDHTVTYQRYVNDIEPDIGTSFYKHLYQSLRKAVAPYYASFIENLRDSSDVIIIDSCISLDPSCLSSIITTDDIACVWNGFPQHMLGRSGTLKMSEQVTYPLKFDHCFYKSIIEGCSEKQVFRPLICSSRIQEICTFVTMIVQRRDDDDKTMVHPISFLNAGNSLEQLKKKTPYLIVETNLTAYKSDKYEVVRLSYHDGTQNGNGITLNYRGETIMRERGSDVWHPLRISLPVIPEATQMSRFPSHDEIKPYLSGLKQSKSTSDITSLSLSLSTSSFTQCFAMPKIDGSLLTVSVNRFDSSQGDFLMSKRTPENEKFIRIIDGIADGIVQKFIVCFGSKSCLFLSQIQMTHIVDSICGSIMNHPQFGSNNHKDIVTDLGRSIDTFAAIAVDFLTNQESVFGSATLFFESVPEHPYNGLTVDYGRSSCSYLGHAIYVDGKSYFRIPDDVSTPRYFAQYAKATRIGCYPDAIKRYFETQMECALKGEVTDLEGFMLVFTSDTDMLHVKVKFPWYYASHKPESHYLEAEQLNTDSKYDVIRSRLVNIAKTIDKFEARKDPVVVFNGFSRIMLDALNGFNTEFKPSTKKDFIVAYRANPTYFTNYVGLYSAMEEAFEKLFLSPDGFVIEKSVPSLWDVYVRGITVDRLSEWFVEHWKITKKY